MMKKMLFAGMIASLVIVTPAQQGYATDVVKLSPEKAVELAKTQSVAVKASQYNVKAQENAVKSAVTAFFPVLSASASAMHIFDKPQMALGGGALSFPFDSTTSQMDAGDWQTLGALAKMFSGISIETPNNMYSGSLSIAQPIFTGGRIINGYRAVKYGLEAQKHSHDRTVTEIGLAAQKFFWGYVGALKGLEAVQETRQWFETLLKDQKKMYDNGLIIELDILNSKIQLDNFKLTEDKLSNAIRTTADQLLLFLGLQPGSVIDPDTAMLAVYTPGTVSFAADSVDRLIAGREDLQAMSSEISALRALKGLQLGAYSPVIAAFGSYGANNQYSTTERDMKKSSSVGVQLNWTLFDWGKAWRDAQKVEFQLQAAQLQADNMRDQIRLKYFELSRKVDEAGKACVIAKEDLETSRKALNVATLKYNAQAITNTELLNARNQLTGKIVAYAQARINVILAIEEFKVASVGAASAQQAQ
jgi:outer membrane protein